MSEVLPKVNLPSLLDIEKKSEEAIKMVFNNKVNSSNAFDIDTGFMKELTNLLNQQSNAKIAEMSLKASEDKSSEISWIKTSTGLEAGVKIYGYRVD